MLKMKPDVDARVNREIRDIEDCIYESSLATLGKSKDFGALVSHLPYMNNGEGLDLRLLAKMQQTAAAIKVFTEAQDAALVQIRELGVLKRLLDK